MPSVPGQGLEPQLTDPKSAVLPLDDPGARGATPIIPESRLRVNLACRYFSAIWQSYLAAERLKLDDNPAVGFYVIHAGII